MSGVDWRALYRLQTAMRYMDNSASLTTEAAYRMADEDVASLERQAALPDHLPSDIPTPQPIGEES